MPALIYGARVPLAAAVPMSLLVVGVSSAAALLPRLRQGQVAWGVAGVFGAARAAFAGAAVNWLLDPQVVLIGFAALMIAAGIRMLGEQVPVGGPAPCPAAGSTGAAACPRLSALGSPSGSSPANSASAAAS